MWDTAGAETGVPSGEQQELIRCYIRLGVIILYLKILIRFMSWLPLQTGYFLHPPTPPPGFLLLNPTNIEARTMNQNILKVVAGRLAKKPTQRQERHGVIRQVG